MTETKAERTCADKETLNKLISLHEAERQARKRANEGYKQWQKAIEEAISLEKERLCLECSIITPTHCSARKLQERKSYQISRAEILAQWALLTPEQLQAQIAVLEKGAE